MKNIKRAAIAVFGVASLMMPAVAQAATLDQIENCGDAVDAVCDQTPTSTLNCNDPGVEVFDPTSGCDLSIDKQVSVNGGAYVEADTSPAAAQAQVGDTITWKITVDNASTGTLVPKGILTVSDVSPAGAAFDSYTATTGTYSSGLWTFDVFDNLPATLTITSHAVSTGLFKNTASFTTLDWCNDGCIGVYSDSNPANNSNDAWFDPSAKPVVLAESTLVNTGSGTAAQTAAAGALIAAALAALMLGRKRSYQAER